MTREREVWIRLIEAVEDAEKVSEDSRISDEIAEFRVVRREDSRAAEKRKNLLVRQKTVKQLDEELYKIGPERLRLSEEEVAIETVRSVARTIFEVPLMLERTQSKLLEVGKYSSKPSVVWRDEAGAFETQGELLQALQVQSNPELNALAKEVLDILDDGEKNGWQV
ncbi:hypothetical protein [Deinococcus aluminii]|uniref:hypothetical protein n=1 Tax=Deinococcus aluminii TaxID=1656885 RepID=UPI0031E90316